ncbi:MAG: GtrA family protein [Bacteroidales bacterium]|nr:GtrA family protein [Bacteroidales bacterium]
MPKRLNQIIDSLLRHPTGNVWIQIVRYFFSGGVAFLVDTGLLYVLTEFCGVYYLISSIISFSIGLIITYLLSILWVFDNRNMKNRYAEFSVFVLIGVVGLGLTSLFMWFFTDKIGVHYIFSKIITTIIVFVWNFIAKKSLLFRNGEK